MLRIWDHIPEYRKQSLWCNLGISENKSVSTTRTVEVDTSKSPSHYGSGSCATYSAQDIYISTCDTEFPVKQEQTEVDHQEFCLHWIVWGLILPIDLAHRSCPLILPIDLAPLTSCPFTPILNMPAENEDEAQDSDPPGLETDEPSSNEDETEP